MASRGVRLARGWAGAAAATFAAAISHALAGGGIPSLPTALLSLALSGLVCTLLAGRVLSFWRMASAVVLSQSVFHWLFSADAAMAGSPAALPQGVHGGHDMGSMTMLAMSGSATGHSAMNHDSALMWLNHILAAAVTITVLRHGEASTVRLIRALRLRLIRLLPVFRPVALAAGSRFTPAQWPVLAVPNLGVPMLAMRHRGPPLLSPVS